MYNLSPNASPKPTAANTPPTKLNHSAPRVVSERVVGEVRDHFTRYGMQLHWDGRLLSGSYGGRWLGERVQLEWNGQELLGVVAFGFERQAVSVRVHEDATTGGSTLSLRLSTPNGVQRSEATITRDHVVASSELIPGSPVPNVHIDLKTTGNELHGVSSDGRHEQFLRLHYSPALAQHLPLPVAITALLLADILNRQVAQSALENLRLMGDA
jgi:hypothetical protein